jgi:hypothetical protein
MCCLLSAVCCMVPTVCLFLPAVCCLPFSACSHTYPAFTLTDILTNGWCCAELHVLNCYESNLMDPLTTVNPHISNAEAIPIR